MSKAAVFLLCIAFVQPALATVVLDLTGPELAAVSDAIVHARVISVRAQATPDARVLTTAEIEVIEGLKGASAGTRLRVIYPGGVASGLGMLVSGQVALSENTECVIYLTKHDNGAFLPAAMTLGYFSVDKRDYDGVRMAQRSTAGVTLVRRVRVAGQVQTVVQEPRALRSPLTILLSDIRKDLQAARTIKREDIIGGGR
jgi:hypothetical protein